MTHGLKKPITKKASVVHTDEWIKSLSMHLAKGLIDSYTWETICQYMDSDIREMVHNNIAPCSEVDFLIDYVVYHYKKFNNWFDIN
jgi:hypothetical protein